VCASACSVPGLTRQRRNISLLGTSLSRVLYCTLVATGWTWLGLGVQEKMVSRNVISEIILGPLLCIAL
jgi:hypothetical protein